MKKNLALEPKSKSDILEEKLKWQIETDLFYLFECKHCQIVTLVEEESEHFENPKHPDKIVLTCPVCHTENLIPKGQNRLKLLLDRIMKPDEINPWYTTIIERSKEGEK
jgi:Zn finger protein HypA/HybF involved in hydrogenase expression